MPSITIKGIPKALKRHRFTKTGRVYDPNTKDKNIFKAKMLEFRPKTPIEGTISLSLIFTMPRPKSHYKTGKNKNVLKDNAPFYHTIKPDVDNLIKMVADCMNGVFFEDDKQIAYVTALKIYGNSPSTCIVINKIEDIYGNQSAENGTTSRDKTKTRYQKASN